MSLLSFTAAEYARQFQRLLPRGRIWHRGVGRVQDADIEVLMPTWVRLGVQLNDLIAEIFRARPKSFWKNGKRRSASPIRARARSTRSKSDNLRSARNSRRAAVRVSPISRPWPRRSARRSKSSSSSHSPPATTRGSLCVARAGPMPGRSLRSRSPSRISRPVSWLPASHCAVGVTLFLECTLQAIKPAHTVLIFIYQQTWWDEGESVWDSANRYGMKAEQALHEQQHRSDRPDLQKPDNRKRARQFLGGEGRNRGFAGRGRRRSVFADLGGTLRGPLTLAGDPTGPLESATRNYSTTPSPAALVARVAFRRRPSATRSPTAAPMPFG